MQPLGVAGASAPGVIAGHDIEPMALLEVREIVEGFDHVRNITAAFTKKLGANHRDIPIHSYHTNAITPRRPNDSSYMGAMVFTWTVINTIVIIVKVPAAHIINITITVIIYAIQRFKRIQPSIGRKIGMCEIKTLVNESDIHRAGAGDALVPSRLRIAAKGIGGASGARRGRRVTAIHPPEGAIDIAGVIAPRPRLHRLIHLGVADPGQLAIGRQRPLQTGARLQLDHLKHTLPPILHREGVNQLMAGTANAGQSPGSLLLCGVAVPLHQDPHPRRTRARRGWRRPIGDPKGHRPTGGGHALCRGPRGQERSEASRDLRFRLWDGLGLLPSCPGGRSGERHDRPGGGAGSRVRG